MWVPGAQPPRKPSLSRLSGHQTGLLLPRRLCCSVLVRPRSLQAASLEMSWPHWIRGQRALAWHFNLLFNSVFESAGLSRHTGRVSRASHAPVSSEASCHRVEPLYFNAALSAKHDRKMTCRKSYGHLYVWNMSDMKRTHTTGEGQYFSHAFCPSLGAINIINTLCINIANQELSQVPP